MTGPRVQCPNCKLYDFTESIVREVTYGDGGWEEKWLCRGCDTEFWLPDEEGENENAS